MLKIRETSTRSSCSGRMVAINIASLKEGTHEFLLEPAAEELDLDSERFGSIRVAAQLNYYNGRIVVTLRSSAVATLECDRTLELFDRQLEGVHVLLFVPPGALEAEEEEYEDVRILHPSDREIDITEPVRDTILLSVPARCVAPGAEEIDLPVRFGAREDEIDPRWEALAKLRSARETGDST